MHIIWKFFTEIVQFFNFFQINSLFRLIFKLLHFEEVVLDELVFALSVKFVASVGLIYVPNVVNPICACVLGFNGDVNWSDTYVCYVFFF